MLLPKALAIDFIKAKTGSPHHLITTTLQKLGVHHIDLHMTAYHKAAQKNGSWKMMTSSHILPESSSL
eukprot:9460273-Ditylum_brightwellii.AAC.1